MTRKPAASVARVRALLARNAFRDVHVGAWAGGAALLRCPFEPPLYEACRVLAANGFGCTSLHDFRALPGVGFAVFIS